MVYVIAIVCIVIFFGILCKSSSMDREREEFEEFLRTEWNKGIYYDK